eukprot:Rhum_TRINITY_DN4418_c0_g1::Rhum_TRINITY_DN4418_c0_g1_i2::g.14333::m.14333
MMPPPSACFRATGVSRLPVCRSSHSRSGMMSTSGRTRASSVCVAASLSKSSVSRSSGSTDHDVMFTTFSVSASAFFSSVTSSAVSVSRTMTFFISSPESVARSTRSPRSVTSTTSSSIRFRCIVCIANVRSENDFEISRRDPFSVSSRVSSRRGVGLGGGSVTSDESTRGVADPVPLSPPRAGVLATAVAATAPLPQAGGEFERIWQVRGVRTTLSVRSVSVPMELRSSQSSLATFIFFRRSLRCTDIDILPDEGQQPWCPRDIMKVGGPCTNQRETGRNSTALGRDGQSPLFGWKVGNSSCSRFQ